MNLEAPESIAYKPKNFFQAFRLFLGKSDYTFDHLLKLVPVQIQYQDIDGYWYSSWDYELGLGIRIKNPNGWLDTIIIYEREFRDLQLEEFKKRGTRKRLQNTAHLLKISIPVILLYFVLEEVLKAFKIRSNMDLSAIFLLFCLWIYFRFHKRDYRLQNIILFLAAVFFIFDSKNISDFLR